MMSGITNQVDLRQPRFFDEIEEAYRDTVQESLFGPAPDGFEAEIIMFGRSADCGDDDAETSPALFPGWAEQAGSSVLFNGNPISIVIPPLFGAPDPPEPSFFTEISFNDLVRVTGALVFDHGHGDDSARKLEIHPVYSIDKRTATFAGLSGAWADDVGNTYYLRHDPMDNTVWFAGLSPLSSAAFAQVFRGTFYPAHVMEGPPVLREMGASPVTPPQNVLIGDVVAIDLGWGVAPPFEVSGTRLGDTGPVTFVLGNTEWMATDIVRRNVPTLSVGSFRLMKLYDAADGIYRP
jgi:hypothetical protein